MRLGEHFIKKGIITKEQLEQALRAQLIFGGHLGTCLLEMGLVDELLLGETLASIFGVRYAPPGLFADVPRSVIASMPQRLVEKHHAVPFERTNRKLHLAMIDPKNLPALDEISFATNCKVEAWVAPEARIFQVMERYYDIPRRQRYIAVCQDLDKGAPGDLGSAAPPSRPSLTSSYAPPPYLEALSKARETDDLSAPPPEPTTATSSPLSEPEEEMGGPPPAPPMFGQAPALPSPDRVVPAAARWTPTSPAAPPRPEPEVNEGGPPPAPPAFAQAPPAPPARKAHRAEAPASFRYAVGPSTTSPGPVAPTPAPDAGPFSQDALSNRLCQTETAEDLMRCALDYAARGLERSALFLIKSTTASLWCSRGLGWDQDRGRILNLSVTSDPLFELLLERDHFRGPVPEDVGIHASFKSMKIEVPSELVLIPGYVEDRLVVLLYGDGGANGAVQAETADLCTFVRKLAYALHVVMLKRKIRSLDLRPPTNQPMRAA